MALGARAGAVVRMVLRDGVALAVCGIGLGIALNGGLDGALVGIFDREAQKQRRKSERQKLPAPNDGSPR